MATGKITDESGSIDIVWFNQPYLGKMIKDGSMVKIEGKVSERKSQKYMSNPKIEVISNVPQSIGDSLFIQGSEKEEFTLYPVYPESKGVTSNWIFHTVQKIFKSGILEKIDDPIPQDILNKYNLPSLKTALVWIHSPKNKNDALSARKRFAFEEIFFIQLKLLSNKEKLKDRHAYKIETSWEKTKKFIDRFPFKPTEAQISSIKTILSDLEKNEPMSRLLEGDVGSGKTAVAAATVYAIIATHPPNQNFGNLQIAYMVPTEILAKQQFANFIQFFRHMPINIGLITSSGCYKFPSKVTPDKPTNISRNQLLKWVANGEVPVLLGTHSLIQKNVSFKHLAYVIIDEQHRFGVLQRQSLTNKSSDAPLPHLLSMTATPIPRTLALTIYGDLDLSVLDQMPIGRKPIITEIIDPTHRNKTYEEIRKEIRKGRQVYIICPRIDEPDPTKELALNAKSVKAEQIRLKKEIFPEFEIDILHSKMTANEKEMVMKNFESGNTNILVSTSVVEVGVNVPNATIIVIEGAERFGLSQLHQLRGRVIRSNHQAYCYIFTDSKSDTAQKRLEALKQAKNGFELAEFDLLNRGTGSLLGSKQWGVSDIGMEALKNIKMVEFAREESKKIITDDPDLRKHLLIKEKIDRKKDIHFE